MGYQQADSKNNESIKSRIQEHLYCHPFYNWFDESEKIMQILVVGDGAYASLFVDQSMQTGQMIDKKLVVDWCIGEEKTKSEYLNARPGLKDFISVDSGKTTWEPYAELHFEKMDNVIDVFGGDCRYVFVATEDERYNEDTAGLFKQAGREDALVAYLTEGIIRVSFSGRNDTPEYVEIIGAKERISSAEEMERMAFNTHRVWEGAGNLDFEGVRTRFYLPYNYNASISFVLSIPYKLRSIGVFTNDPYKAAEELYQIIQEAENDKTPEKEKILSKLGALEHKRWVVEKITEGARRLIDKNGNPEYASCLARKSVKKKGEAGNLLMHPCIVPSTENTPLNKGKYADKKAWDDFGLKTDQLDELDKVSLGLHRIMYRGANQVRSHREDLERLTDDLKRICWSGEELLKRNYDRFYFCIENVIDKSTPYSSQYETYEKMLKNSLEKSDLDEKDEAGAIIQQIGEMLYPVLESNMYRDYKEYDVQLVKQIPFILTSNSKTSICMSLGEVSQKRNDNDENFKSVASATALYAEKLVYLLVYSRDTDLDVLKSKMKALHKYFYYRGINCSIEIVLCTCKAVCHVNEINNVIDILSEAKETGYIKNYAYIDATDYEDFGSQIVSYIEESGVDYYDGTNMLLNSGIENGRIQEKISKKIPYFEFDSYHKEFLNCINCEYLKYTDITSFIQVEDMFALLNAKDKAFNYQDYSDCYKDLWDIYCGEAIRENDFPLCARCWTRVANILKTGGEHQLHINNVEFGTSEENEKRIIIKMLKELRNRGFLKTLSFAADSSSAKNLDDRVTCDIKNRKTKKIFLKAGELLEIYVYFEACKTDWFDDVQTGYSLNGSSMM